MPNVNPHPQTTTKQLLADRARITHLEGVGNYTIVWAGKQKLALHGVTLSRLCTRAPYLLRVYKRYAVNPDAVVSIQYNTKSRGGELTLRDGTVLPVSRRRWTAVELTLQELSTSVQYA